MAQLENALAADNPAFDAAFQAFLTALADLAVAAVSVVGEHGLDIIAVLGAGGDLAGEIVDCALSAA
jgi:hypothetical protein